MFYENYLGNKTAWKIIRVLAESPYRGTSREEIRKITKSGNYALSNALKLLKNYSIINSKKIGKKEVYWLNPNSEIVKGLIYLCELEKENLKGLSPSKIIFLSKVVEKIIEGMNPLKVVLFGSHAKGIATSQSDYDICVVVDKKKRTHFTTIAKLPENVEIHLFEKKEFIELKKRKDPLVEEILKDGIDLTPAKLKVL